LAQEPLSRVAGDEHLDHKPYNRAVVGNDLTKVDVLRLVGFNRTGYVELLGADRLLL
jgi:hypothetical protein